MQECNINYWLGDKTYLNYNPDKIFILAFFMYFVLLILIDYNPFTSSMNASVSLLNSSDLSKAVYA